MRDAHRVADSGPSNLAASNKTARAIRARAQGSQVGIQGEPVGYENIPAFDAPGLSLIWEPAPSWNPDPHIPASSVSPLVRLSKQAPGLARRGHGFAEFLASLDLRQSLAA